MNPLPDINPILVKFLEGELTDYEKEKLGEWKEASPQNAYELEQLTKLWKERSIGRKVINASELKSKIWRQGVGEGIDIPEGSKKQLSFFTIAKRMAAMIVLFSIIGVLYWINKNIGIAEAENTTQEYVRKSNPAGQKSKIFLSDGSVVWLNAKSSISYYKHFTDSCRKVTLEGEAFFDVARDTVSPFIVIANGVHVQVIGTQFNVNARNPNNNVSVALLAGVVEVFVESDDRESEKNIMHPGEGIIISAEHQDTYNFTFDPNEKYNPYSSWKDGILCFDGDTYEEFVAKIQLWFGIEVQTNGSPPSDWVIRGDFPNETLENIMKTISYNKGFTYDTGREKLMLNFNLE